MPNEEEYLPSVDRDNGTYEALKSFEQGGADVGAGEFFEIRFDLY